MFANQPPFIGRDPTANLPVKGCGRFHLKPKLKLKDTADSKENDAGRQYVYPSSAVASITTTGRTWKKEKTIIYMNYLLARIDTLDQALGVFV